VDKLAIATSGPLSFRQLSQTPSWGLMSQIWIDGAVASIGLVHGPAAYLYFSRESNAVKWPLAWIAATVSCLVMARTGSPWLGYGLFVAIIAAWTLWWARLRPAKTRNWVPENAYQATGAIVGDTLVVKNVRNLNWRTKREFEPHWEDRTYDLVGLRGMDLFVCTWGEPRIAHTMVSFDFADRPALCFSIETRREIGETWTALAGFMKSYELLVIAGDERDLVRSRVNLRGERVRLYRIASTPAIRRKILARYIAQMNRLASRPRYYNTIFHNCTTEIGRIVFAAGHRFPLDWRLLVSGYVDAYLYDQKLLDRSRPFAELKAAADITKRANAADADPQFSRRIRDGLPDPGTPEQVRQRPTTATRLRSPT
jgi:Domain of unknown function (DUF4105)